MYEVKMPRLGVTMQSGTVTEWLVEEGTEVKKGDYLFELETEKSTLEIEAQESGVLKKIMVPADVEVPVNTVIALLGTAEEEVDLALYAHGANEAPAEKAEEDGKGRDNQNQPKPDARKGGISPRARKLAKELGVSLETVKGTGKGGIITEEDVRKASAPSSSSAIKVKETIPLNSVKKAMAQNVLNSWQSIPQFTQMVSVNMTNALAVKKELGDISLNDIIVKTVSNAVKKYPLVNSKLENDNKITVYEEVNISVAVNSSHGLVVPVVKNAESKSVQDISVEIRKLAEKAENKELAMEDYENGTITISNLGSLGIESGTPIVNSPQSTIIFAGAIRKMPIVGENDDISVAPIMVLSVCYDHRFIDGVSGAHFTNEVKKAFENLTVEELN